ncbi:helix-turn-helix domain-containing protein [Rhizobium ruizarguesonis]
MIVLRPSIARAARAYTGLTHAQLGQAAGVASRTIFKLEKDGKITDESLARIVAVFGHSGIVLLYDEGGAVMGMEFGPRPDGHIL